MRGSMFYSYDVVYELISWSIRVVSVLLITLGLGGLLVLILIRYEETYSKIALNFFDRLATNRRKPINQRDT